VRGPKFSAVRFTDWWIMPTRHPALKRWAILIQSASRTEARLLCRKELLALFGRTRKVMHLSLQNLACPAVHLSQLQQPIAVKLGQITCPKSPTPVAFSAVRQIHPAFRSYAQNVLQGNN